MDTDHYSRCYTAGVNLCSNLKKYVWKKNICCVLICSLENSREIERWVGMGKTRKGTCLTNGGFNHHHHQRWYKLKNSLWCQVNIDWFIPLTTNICFATQLCAILESSLTSLYVFPPSEKQLHASLIKARTLDQCFQEVFPYLLLFPLISSNWAKGFFSVWLLEHWDTQTFELEGRDSVGPIWHSIYL